jgi:hypothetical protein
MTLKNLQKAPFPWFGGKSKAAPLVWSLLGDVAHYVEPFAGSLAVLLNRPHTPNTGWAETVNDLDGLIVNAWRAIQWHPEETAAHASWPVTETDRNARQIALVRWREQGLAAKLGGTPEWCDPKMAGWWIWGVCINIGPFCGAGPWTADNTGRLRKIDRKTEGWDQQGVSAGIVNMPNDRGLLAPSTWEQGLAAENGEYHPHTMPEVIRWFDWLSARLRHVRILNGDWARLVTDGASKTLAVRAGAGPVGLFLDPPYADTASRTDGLYATDDLTVAHNVRQWCIDNGADPERRIVFACYESEHGTVLAEHGWTEHQWHTGEMRGYGAAGTGQQHRERLWASPHCLNPNTQPAHTQGDLFA